MEFKDECASELVFVSVLSTMLGAELVLVFVADVVLCVHLVFSATVGSLLSKSSVK